MNFAFPATAANSASHGLETGSRMKRSSITVSLVPISESGIDFHSHTETGAVFAGAEASLEAPDVDPQDASIATAASATIAVVTFVTNFIFISPP